MFYPLSSAVVTFLSWAFCDTEFAPWLGWLGAFLLIISFNKQSTLTHFFLGGSLLNLLGFYWVATTISEFGDMPIAVGGLVLILFVVTFALQWPLTAYLAHRLPCSNLSFPLCYVAVDFLFPKIFPWSLGHTQIHFPQFIQIADILGVSGIVLIMLWICQSAYSSFSEKRWTSILPAGLCGTAVLAYGVCCLHFLPDYFQGSVSVVVPQANIPAIDKNNLSQVPDTVREYSKLTIDKISGHELVIWPESAFMEWVSTSIKSTRDDIRLPRFNTPTNLLTGALTFKSREEFFNSALAIRSDGSVLPPYHKRILMPFGEYVPGSSVLPFLRDLNANIANFTAGSSPAVFDFTVDDAHVLVSPLICYEDVIPSMARESVQAGATLLVNLTNDVWFGKSLAAKHHNQIAAFRAIENRRTLIRSTNNGLTAIIDPMGATIAALPINQAAVLTAKVPLSFYKSLYSEYFGGWFWWMVSSAVIFFALLKRSLPK